MNFQDVFNVTQSGGNRIAQSFRKVEDENTIERILSEASDTDDPAVVQNSIEQILSNVSPERQPQAIAYLKSVGEKIDQKKQKEAMTKAGFDPDLPDYMNKMIFESQKETPSLKLNEELNQQKSRTKSVVEDIVRPYGMMDPLTRLISWRGDVAEEKRDEINKKISKERKKSFNTMKKLYQKYGQPLPADLEETFEMEQADENSVDPQKVAEAYRLLRGQ